MDKNKYIGICRVGEKGQIVIPKEVRNIFNINSGDSIIVLCDKEKGIALVKSDIIEDFTDKILFLEELGFETGDVRRRTQFIFIRRTLAPPAISACEQANIARSLQINLDFAWRGKARLSIGFDSHHLLFQ